MMELFSNFAFNQAFLETALGFFICFVVGVIGSAPLVNTIEVLFEPLRMSYRRANFSYGKFYKWFKRRNTLEKICDWLFLWPAWGYLFYVVGQFLRLLFVPEFKSDSNE